MTRPMIKQHRRPDGVMERPIVEIFHISDVSVPRATSGRFYSNDPNFFETAPTPEGDEER